MNAPRLVPLSSEPTEEPLRTIFARFHAEGREPLALYRVLSHAPSVLYGLDVLAQALRYDAGVPRLLRELMILRTAQLTDSRYEWAHHHAMASELGLAEEKLSALASWRESVEFEPEERAVLECAEALHTLSVSDEQFVALERHFSPQQIVELVLTGSFYQSAARVLQAFAVPVEPAYEQFAPP